MPRRPAGAIRIKDPQGNWRRIPYVMGGSARISDGEYVETIWADRPVMITRQGLPLFAVPAAPVIWTPDPWAVGAGVLRFNRLR